MPNSIREKNLEAALVEALEPLEDSNVAFYIRDGQRLGEAAWYDRVVRGAKRALAARVEGGQVMLTKTIDDFTDAELAGMVRRSIYAKNTRFGCGETDARFLFVLAVPYGNDEGCTELPVALEALQRLMDPDEGGDGTDVQVLDFAACQTFYSATLEEARMNADNGEDSEDAE